MVKTFFVEFANRGLWMKKIIIIFMVFSLCLAAQAEAQMHRVKKVRAGTPPYEVIKMILSANNRALKQGVTVKKSGFAPYLTWLTDPDPRINSNLIIDKAGQVYAVRNFGDQLSLATGAIDYGVRHLLTPVLMITSNSDNKAVKFFMDGYEDLSPAIRQDLDHLYLALVHDDKKAVPVERLRLNIEANVDYQVALAVSRYHDRVRSGRLVVVGSVLDFDNTYKHGSGRLVIININGEQNSLKLKKMPMLKYVGPKFINLAIGRTVKGKAKVVVDKGGKAASTTGQK